MSSDSGTRSLAITAYPRPWSSGKLVMEASLASSQHSLTIGENAFRVHLTSRSRWTNEFGGGSYHVLLQIVDGVVVVDHRR